MIVASHPRDTEGVITTDTAIESVGVPVIWE